MQSNYFSVLELAQKKGYSPPMELKLLLEKSPKDKEKKFSGDGRHLASHLEADRKNVFKSIFQEEWKTALEFAQEKYSSEDFDLAIDFILGWMDEEKE